MGFLGFDNLDEDKVNQGLQATGSPYRMSTPQPTPSAGAPPAGTPAPTPAPVVQTAPTAAPPVGQQAAPDLTEKQPEEKKDEEGFNIMGLVTKLFGI